MIIFQPAKHLQRFAFGEGIGAVIARKLRKNRRDGAGAIERADETIFGQADAMKRPGVTILDDADAVAALLLNAEAQPFAQPGSQGLGLDDGTIFVRRFHFTRKAR